MAKTPPSVGAALNLPSDSSASDTVDPLDPSFSIDEYLKIAGLPENEVEEEPTEGIGEDEESPETLSAEDEGEEEEGEEAKAAGPITTKETPPVPSPKPKDTTPPPVSGPDLDEAIQRAYESGRAHAQVEAERKIILLRAEVRQLGAAQREEKSQLQLIAELAERDKKDEAADAARLRDIEGRIAAERASREQAAALTAEAYAEVDAAGIPRDNPEDPEFKLLLEHWPKGNEQHDPNLFRRGYQRAVARVLARRVVREEMVAERGRMKSEAEANTREKLRASGATVPDRGAVASAPANFDEILATSVREIEMNGDLTPASLRRLSKLASG